MLTDFSASKHVNFLYFAPPPMVQRKTKLASLRQSFYRCTLCSQNYEHLPIVCLQKNLSHILSALFSKTSNDNLCIYFIVRPLWSTFYLVCKHYNIKGSRPVKDESLYFRLTTFYSIRRISPLICVPFNGGYRQRLLNFIRSLDCSSRVMFIYLLLVFGFHLIRTLYNVHYALFMQGNYCLYQRFYYFIVLLDFFLLCYSNLTNISCQLF